MNKRILILPIAVAGLALGACSQKARDESATAGNTMAADTNATMYNATNDVDAASDRAFGSAEQQMDNAGDSFGNAADSAGRAISNGADRAADATGQGLKNLGNSLQD